MSEFNDIFTRIKIEELAPYFLYGGESITESTTDYEQRIDKSFKETFEHLKELCGDSNKNAEEIRDILFDFSLVYSDVYLQMGVLMGFQLFKVLEQDFYKAKTIGAEDVLKQYINLFSKTVVKDDVSEE